MSPITDFLTCHRSLTYDQCHRSLTLSLMRFRSPSELGAIIRERRRKLGLEQKTLAEQVGVSRQWIIDIEKGKPRAAVGLVLRTVNALGILLDASDEPTRRLGRSASAPDIDAVVAAARKPRS